MQQQPDKRCRDRGTWQYNRQTVIGHLHHGTRRSADGRIGADFLTQQLLLSPFGSSTASERRAAVFSRLRTSRLSDSRTTPANCPLQTANFETSPIPEIPHFVRDDGPRSGTKPKLPSAIGHLPSLLLPSAISSEQPVETPAATGPHPCTLPPYFVPPPVA